tara:strand:+ start:621 stop:1016 length:396 start_codon:yes stop_codon:yes gene_type:complete
MEVELLKPDCNLDTVKDGRGGIFTWIPDEPIVEWNLNIIKEGRVRGHHYHPEFVEYFLVVEGSGVHISIDSEGNEKFFHLSVGQCLKIPKNIPHVFHAIKDTTAIALLTKKWDKSSPPIIHVNVDEKKDKK